MMRPSRTGRRRWVTVLWGMSRPSSMRWWPPRRRRRGAPSRPLSRAGPVGPTIGSRATPIPALRWRRVRVITTPVTWRARGPRSARALRTQPAFRWATVIEPLVSVSARAFGRGWPVSRRGGGVRWRRRSAVTGPVAINRGPLAGATVSARITASSFWTGLMLSPWRLSVVRGTQLPQCVGAHVPLGYSGTLSRLRWSVTL